MEFAATACPEVIPFVKVISEPVKATVRPTTDKVVDRHARETYLLVVHSSTVAKR